jgi:pimeloyl-ACP methyl ester carboxylesterase
MGAGVSLAFALDHPERVHKLLLVAPPGLSETIEPARQLFNGLATLIETQGIEKAVEVAMQLPQFAEMKDSQPEEYAEVREWLLSQRPRAVVPAIRGLLNGPQFPEERFGEITAPALIVAHPDDPIHPQSSAEKLHAAIAGSRLIVAPEAMYFQEHHDELLEAIAAFLHGDG